MKHVKLFEDFFSFFLYSFPDSPDMKKLWGYNREEIEDFFIDINDYGLSISIDFNVDGWNYNSSFSRSVIQNLYTLYKNGEIKPKIEIHIFMNKTLNDKILNYPNNRNPFYSNKNGYKEEREYFKGLSDTIIDVEKMLVPITNGRISGYECKIRMGNPHNVTGQKQIKSTSTSTHPENGINYGTNIASVFLTRKEYSSTQNQN